MWTTMRHCFWLLAPARGARLIHCPHRRKELQSSGLTFSFHIHTTPCFLLLSSVDNNSGFYFSDPTTNTSLFGWLGVENVLKIFVSDLIIPSQNHVTSVKRRTHAQITYSMIMQSTCQISHKLAGHIKKIYKYKYTYIYIYIKNKAEY